MYSPSFLAELCIGVLSYKECTVLCISFLTVDLLTLLFLLSGCFHSFPNILFCMQVEQYE